MCLTTFLFSEIMKAAVRCSTGKGCKMVNRIAKKINKQSFLNKVRIIYTLLVMLPVLVLDSSTNFIKEQQLLEAKENIERNHLNIENQIKMCEKSVLYVTCNSVLREFLSLDDSEYKKRIQMTSNVNNLIYNAWLSNSYFSKMEVYSDKRKITVGMKRVGIAQILCGGMKMENIL